MGWKFPPVANNCFEMWWPGTELNRRRQPFQGCALPPELPGHVSKPQSAACEDSPLQPDVGGTNDRSQRKACGTHSIIATVPLSLNVTALQTNNELTRSRKSSSKTNPGPHRRHKSTPRSPSQIQPDSAAPRQTDLSRSTVSDLPSKRCRRCRDGSTESLPQIPSGTWPP